ncbi:MAG: hypothetical protein ACTTJW_06970 [Sphaerochaeta sp.]
MSIPVARKEDGPKKFVNGYGEVEILKGTHPLVRTFMCELKAGSNVNLELFKDKIAVYCFIKGEGYITTKNHAFNINEISFFVPNFNLEDVRLYAVSDLQIVKFVTTMLESDKARYKKTHTLLPFFKPLSQADKYTQDCKGPNTISWSIIHPGSLARELCGVVKAYGKGEGTVEKGHPSVDQWNVIIDGSDLELDVEGEKVHHVGGEVSYIVAGPDHSLIPSDDNSMAFYIWYEHQTKEYSMD